MIKPSNKMPTEETNLLRALIYHSWPADPSETRVNTATKAAQSSNFVILITIV